MGGFHRGNRIDARLLVEAGFAMIGPDSFARADKPARLRSGPR